MVTLIPDDETLEDFNGCAGERLLYDRMKEMKGDYYIFQKCRRKSISNGEKVILSFFLPKRA